MIIMLELLIKIIFNFMNLFKVGEMGRKGFLSGLMSNGGYDDIEHNPNRMQKEQSATNSEWGWEDNNSTNS